MDAPEHTRIERGERCFDWMERQHPESRIGQAFAQMMRWLNEYPSAGRADVEARLRGKGVEQFEGAFLELYLHRLLRHTLPGVEATITPATIGASKPDLQLVRSGEAVKVEVTAFRHLEAERALDHDGMDILREATRFVTTPGFMLWIESFQRGTTEPKKARVGSLIDQILRNDERRAIGLVLVRSARAAPRSSIRPESLAANSGNTTVFHGRVPDRLRDAIEGKLEQHRNDQAPLIIAVCCNAWPGEPDDETCCSVLLGTEYWTFPRNGGGSPSGPHRASRRTVHADSTPSRASFGCTNDLSVFPVGDPAPSPHALG
jgi:hypothetical protein